MRRGQISRLTRRKPLVDKRQDKARGLRHAYASRVTLSSRAAARRSATASFVHAPDFHEPFALPIGAPELDPPCRRHTRFPRIAGEQHDVARRVRAWQRGAFRRLSGSFRFIGLPSVSAVPRVNVDVLMFVSFIAHRDLLP